LNNKELNKNFVYEVEVNNHQHDEEFALELFELLEGENSQIPLTKIHTFKELLDWNEELGIE
jgi:hypothetical protein